MHRRSPANRPQYRDPRGWPTCVTSPRIAHRGAGITAPRKTQAGRPRRNAPMLDEARLLTASSLIHVDSQPFLHHPVTRWTSPVERQSHLLPTHACVGIPSGETRFPWSWSRPGLGDLSANVSVVWRRCSNWRRRGILRTGGRGGLPRSSAWSRGCTRPSWPG